MELLSRSNLMKNLSLFFNKESNIQPQFSISENILLLGVEKKFLPDYLLYIHSNIQVWHKIFVIDHPSCSTDENVKFCDISQLLNNKYTLHVYSEDPDPSSVITERSEFLPIGLPSRGIENSELWIAIAKKSLPLEERKKKACISFFPRDYPDGFNKQNRLSAGISARRTDSGMEAIANIAPWSVERQINFITELSKYAFVICPTGKGLDTHRLWEALLMGCIPIVETSQLDPLYQKFPIVIVKNWDEVTEENLEKWLTIYAKKFWTPHGEVEPYLTADYWSTKNVMH